MFEKHIHILAMKHEYGNPEIVYLLVFQNEYFENQGWASYVNIWKYNRGLTFMESRHGMDYGLLNG